MQNLLCIDIPIFQPEYKRWKKYGYAIAEEKQNLKEVLNDTTGGYCMYCYSRIKTDGKFLGHLEHAIEKGNSDRLIECIPDIGLACPVCNLSFKRRGENNRKIDKNLIRKFEQKCSCRQKRKQCTVVCRPLRRLQKNYSELPDAEILLQPMNIETENGKVLRLRYNVLKMEFEPLEDDEYCLTNKERQFVRLHIQRFHLNDSKYRTTQLRDLVGLMIDMGGKIPNYEYGNLIVQLFVMQLETKTKEERLKICERIYPILVSVG